MSEIKTFWATDQSGNVIPSPIVTVRLKGTNTLASGLKNSDGNALTNPFTGTLQGQITFSAPDGQYDVTTDGSGRSVTLVMQFSYFTTAAVVEAQAAAETATTKAAEVSANAETVTTKAAEVSANAETVTTKAAEVSANAAASNNTTESKLPVDRNLFDPKRVVTEKYILSNGEMGSNSGYFSSTFIRVNPGVEYTFNSALHAAFYTSGLDFILYLNNPATITTPPNAAYVRFSHLNANLNKVMFVAGTSAPSNYKSFGFNDPQTEKRNILSGGLRIAETFFPVIRNLFDLNRATDNEALGLNGGLYAASGWYVTGMIGVFPSTEYVSNNSSNTNGASWYDENGEFISTFSITNGIVFNSPHNAYYMRQQAYGLSSKLTHMILKGSSIPNSYVGFHISDNQEQQISRIALARKVVAESLPLVRNLFDKERANENTAVSPVNGVTYTASNYFATNLIAVSPGDAIYSTINSLTGAWFDVSGKFISGFSGMNAQPTVAPNGAYYIKFQVYGLQNKQSLVVTNSSTAPIGYIPFLSPYSSTNGAWLNRKVVVLGDSISQSGIFIPYFTSGIGASLLSNFAVAGRPVREMGKTISGVVLQASDLEFADFVLIFGGTNDYGGNRNLGIISDAVIGNSGSTFYSDVFNLLNLIYTLKPSVTVMFATPLIRGAMSGILAGQPSYPALNSAGHSLPQYVQAIQQVCSIFGTKVCNLFAESGINLLNLSLFTSDNLHPNDAGSQVFVKRLISCANSI